ISVDATNNVYFTGSFTGTASFNTDSTPLELTSNGGADAFVAKLSAGGSLKYAQGFGGSGADAGRAISVDSAGRTVVTGSFQGTVDFNPGTGSTQRTSVGSDDVFVSSFSPGGTFGFVKTFGGTGPDFGRDITRDTAGNIITVGTFRGTCDFDPNAGQNKLVSLGAQDAFVQELDSAGNLVFARNAGGPGDEIPGGVTTDSNRNAIIVGNFEGTVDFRPGSGTTNLTSKGSRDVFVWRLDSAGRFSYVRQIGGTAGDFANGVALSSEGHALVTGVYSGTADFDPGSKTVNLTAAGTSDAFLARIDAAVPEFGFGVPIGGSNADSIVHNAVDAENSVYVIGRFQGVIDVDPTLLVQSLSSAGGTDVFVAKYASDGSLRWAARFGGDDEDLPGDIAVSIAGVFLTFNFRNTADVDPGPDTRTAVAGGESDAIILKLDANGGYVWSRQFKGAGSVQPTAIALDAGGNVLSTGTLTGQTDFDPGTGTRNLSSSSATDQDFYVSKLNASGQFSYVGRIGGTGSGAAHDLVVNPAGDAFLTGFFTGTSDFNPGSNTFNLNAGGSGIAAFVLRLNSAGGFVFARQFGASGVQAVGNGIALDSDDNIYFTGPFRETVDFDPGSGTFNLVSGRIDQYDGFVVRLDANGNFGFARQYTGGSGIIPQSIAVDPRRNINVVGRFFGSNADFDPSGKSFALSSGGSFDAFVSRLNSSGRFMSAIRLGGTSADQATAVAVGANGLSLFVVGDFSGVVDLNPGGGAFDVGSFGSTDAFILELLL
ncbi:MAG: SBBP repeat-containing protein, partial [Tepidisphaeraceae bacterium]